MKRIFTLLSAVLTLATVDAQQKKFSDLLKPDIKPEHAGRAAGNLADSSMTYNWNGTSWTTLAKKVYTYDAQGRISILKEYDPVTGVLDHQYDYTYHTNGKVSMIIVTGNNGSTMEPFERHRYNFDAENNRTSFRKDNYYLQQWVQDEGDSILYEYDANKRVLSYTLFQIDDAIIYYYQKLIWSDFNTLNQPKTLVVQVYQSGFENYIQLSNMTWNVGYDLFDFTPTSYIGSSWNGAWQPSVYDSSIVAGGKIHKSYMFYWNGVSIIDTGGRTEYLYDTKGHRMQTMGYQYNGSAWSITNGDRDSIEYGSYDEIKKQTLSFYSNSNLRWEYLNEERFYYNGLSIGETLKPTIMLYPNPAHSHVEIDLETAIDEVRLVDLQGRAHAVLLEGKQLDVSSLPAGLYFIQVQSEGILYTGKLEIRP